jgi:hypothetical protein
VGVAVVFILASSSVKAQQFTLIAKGTLTGSSVGSYRDLSGLTYTLENGVPANVLGGLGSGITFVAGNTFLALPDRGPNAVSYNADLDDTASYIPRFHTIKMKLEPNPDPNAALPFVLVPKLRATTLTWPALNSCPKSTHSSSTGSGRDRRRLSRTFERRPPR